MNGRPYKGETLEELRNKGYRQISRKYRMVSRVDISTENMVKFFIKDNFGDKNSGVPAGSIESQKEQYRSVHSNDCIEGVPECILKHLRGW